MCSAVCCELSHVHSLHTTSVTTHGYKVLSIKRFREYWDTDYCKMYSFFIYTITADQALTLLKALSLRENRPFLSLFSGYSQTLASSRSA